MERGKSIFSITLNGPPHPNPLPGGARGFVLVHLPGERENELMLFSNGARQLIENLSPKVQRN